MRYEIIVPLMLTAAAVLVVGFHLIKAIMASKRRRGRRTSSSSDAARHWMIAGLSALVGFIVIPAIGIVPAGYRGVVYSGAGGVLESERGEGFTIIIPWFQHMQLMSVRTQKFFSDKIYAQSEDLQEITVVASVNYHVDPSRAAELYRDVGPDYAQTIIMPALFQQTKAAVGRVHAEDFAANRTELADEIRSAIASQVGHYGIVIEYVNIEDAIFDPAFILAVKNKVIASQTAEEQRRLVRAEKYKKQQAIVQAEAKAQSILIEAKAQARANALVAKSLTNELLQWRSINEWDGVLPQTLVTGSEGTPILLVTNFRQQQAGG